MTIRELRIAALITLTLSSGCLVGPSVDYEPDARTGAVDIGPMELGVVTGAIYETDSSAFVAAEPVFSSHADEISCDLKSFGAKWIRVEVKWENTSDAVYTEIIRAARSQGLKVVAVVPGHYCPSTPNSPLFAVYQNPAQYVAKLRALTGPGGPFEIERPDAFEITNEPNMFENAEASLCNESFRVAPEAYVDLLRAVWEWKKAENRDELIIAGAPLNLYLDNPWWTDALAAMVDDAANGDRPFDYLGVHPYNIHWMNVTNLAANLPRWEADTRAALTRLDQTLACIYREGTLDCSRGGERALFATEFGYPPCPGSETNPDVGADDSGTKCVNGEAEMVATFEASVRAMADSGAVAAALYYNYRDDAAADGGLHGLRRRWDGDFHHLRLDLVDRFRQITGADNDFRCWSRSSESGIGRELDGSVDLPIVSCHQRNGRTAAAGTPTRSAELAGSAYVHDWAPEGPVQSFDGGALGPNLCMRRVDWAEAYMVRGGIRETYLETGGGLGDLGYPIADEEDTGAGPFQRFEGGRILAGDGQWIVELD